MIVNRTGVDPLEVTDTTDIFEELGCVGDDFHELMDEYAKLFTVDMTGYLWYFHADEEGFWNIGGEFFKPPYERVKRIPVTPLMLAEFADQGKWSIDYPNHKLPKIRWDMVINKGVAIGFIVYLILYFFVL